jgi:hypothetical protein
MASPVVGSGAPAVAVIDVVRRLQGAVEDFGETGA